jgi:hypothetical protein
VVPPRVVVPLWFVWNPPAETGPFEIVIAELHLQMHILARIAGHRCRAGMQARGYGSWRDNIQEKFGGEREGFGLLGENLTHRKFSFALSKRLARQKKAKAASNPLPRLRGQNNLVGDNDAAFTKAAELNLRG